MLSARPAALPFDHGRAMPTKTPGRALTKMRNVMQENAIRNAPLTVIGKGSKLVQNTPLQSKTLPDYAAKDIPGKHVGPSKLKDTLAVRPLGDKTPFPNRTTNQLYAANEKITQPSLLDGSLRPSSARKHDRLPRSVGKAFETPITDGKHWDVSDIEIEVDSSAANKSIEVQSYDEIEYMPPKVEDIPYEPPFEMPNYREVGKTLMALIRSYTLEDEPPRNDITFEVSEHNFFEPPILPQQEIEDDSPFARAKPEPEVNIRPSTTLGRKSSKPTPGPAVQRTKSVTRTIAPANSRAPPAVRPSTMSMARLPTTTARAFVSQPVTRAPTSQSTVRAPTTRASSASRSTPPVRAGVTQLSRTTSVTRSTVRPAAQPAAPIKGKTGTMQHRATPTARNPPSNAPPNTARPRSGTITKEAFESNTHVVVHVRNHSLEDVKKDLEGLIVFEDVFDEDDGFRFDV